MAEGCPYWISEGCPYWMCPSWTAEGRFFAVVIRVVSSCVKLAPLNVQPTVDELDAN